MTALSVGALLYLFLLGINGVGAGSRVLGSTATQAFFTATADPVVGLMIGILATTIVQSSSVTTSMLVALVAAPENPIPLVNAVPIIMGANVGTTVTNTLASLAHAGRSDEFRPAFAVATVHDFFNYIAVIVLLPLEHFTGVLRHSAVAGASALSGVGGAHFESPLKAALEVGGAAIQSGLGLFVRSDRALAAAYVGLSAILVFVTLAGIVRVLRRATTGRAEELVSRALTGVPLLGIAVGLVATMLVQSSSITTSMLVPLAGAGVITLAQAFPITIGANIGTTVTALLAALAVTGENASAGLSIALVHLFFNVSAAVLIYGISPLRRVPIFLSESLAELATRSKRWAFVYVLGLFYLLPLAIALIDRAVR